MITPQQLHQWYLEATKELHPESYNQKAQKPYEELTEDQKKIDEYITGKINNWHKEEQIFQQRLIDDVWMLQNMKHVRIVTTDDGLEIRLSKSILKSLNEYGQAGYRDIKTYRLVSLRICKNYD